MKYLMIIVVISLIVACETPTVRREDFAAKHPDWDPQMVEVIRAGMIAKGMTKEQVRAAWGEPCNTCQGTRKWEWGESWEYRTQVVFFNTEGLVIRWGPK
ncbi:hypothetical protein Nhal_1724 [Nitrosococcus halophilus Nc 4]|uniref:Lipoprotein n=1 Tax=Nitrosococcus halophilus (strain Nc4) TaxID=472759 RepID=D5C2I9_NITHN|nr:hypothetical protein [Nitrosococcus halophilus]ADE14848.1 hypothetical protein Nhal_1724 [Nitrosococcus halophilus Nc 4]